MLKSYIAPPPIKNDTNEQGFSIKGALMMFQIILRPHKTNKDVTNFFKDFCPLCKTVFPRR